MKKLLLIIACMLLLSSCGHVKLSNGENAIVTLEGVDAISSEDLYKELKKASGTNTLIRLIDKKILSKLYKTTNEEKEYINDAIKLAKKNAKDMGVDLNLYLTYYQGINSEDEYKENLSLDYKRKLWVNDYAKESVNEKQINEYYEKEYFGDIDAKHILITVDVNSNASSDEKTKAEKEAYNKAVEVINKLNEGKNFDDLVKEYSKDKATSSKNGSLGKINIGSYQEEVVQALKNLENGKYSTTPIKSSYGYHIVYKINQDEKKSLKDSEDTIRTIIGNELKENDANFQNKALIELRKKHKIDIKDSEIKKEYENLTKSYQQ